MMVNTPIIDSHYHICRREYKVSSTNNFLCVEKPDNEIINDMQIANISKSIVFGMPSLDYDLSKINEYVLNLFNKYPDNIIPFAILEENINVKDWIKKGVKGFKEHTFGLKIQKNNKGEDILASETRKNNYKIIADNNLPLLSHFGQNFFERIMDIVEYVPDINIIVAHSGYDFINDKINENNLKSLTKYDNIYFDISAIKNIEIIKNIFRITGPDKVVWGSDFPYETQELSLKKLFSMNSFSKCDLEKLLYTNILKLLNKEKVN